MRFPLALRAVLPLLVLYGASGCDTVDLGDPPADLNACRPDQTFFFTEVYPKFLDRSFGGKKCGDSGCHSANSGRPLVIVAPTTNPTIPLPPDWSALYKSVTAQMQCTNVSESSLLLKPGGLQHEGGKLIDIDGAEALLVKNWVGIK